LKVSQKSIKIKLFIQPKHYFLSGSMTDERIRKLAKLVVEHSVFVKKGENVMISSGTEAIPLVREHFLLLHLQH